MKKAPHRKKQKGWLSGMKEPVHGTPKRMTLGQWVTIVPVFLAMVAIIGLFVYLTLFQPDLAQGIHMVRTQVLDRVEKFLADGKPDLRGSYLLVRIEGAELHLQPVEPGWSLTKKGDTIEVEVAPGSAAGTPRVYSYKRVDAPPPAPESR